MNASVLFGFAFINASKDKEKAIIGLQIDITYYYKDSFKTRNFCTSVLETKNLSLKKHFVEKVP